MNTQTVTKAITYSLAAACIAAAPASAQQPWQKLQTPTAAEVSKIWLNPPSEYGPEPYFGMNGGVTIESLAKDLDTMRSLGFHAVTAQAGGNMSTTYLSPEYFAFFKQFVLEAKKRDMKVWIVDDIGYPSGFAGGVFSPGKPSAKLTMQALTVAQRLPVASGASLKQSVDPDTVAVTAVSSTGEKKSIPVTNNSIDFTAPAGDWTVLVITHVNRTSPTKSDTNPAHTKDSSQPLEDYLDPAATAAYLESTHNGYFKAMPEEFGTTIMGFRGDEPDYSISGLPWTPAFFDTFAKQKGYDIRPYLASMLTAQAGRGQKAAPLSDQELRARADYYDVFSQLFRDGFFKPQGDWCAAHHVEYQVHLNHEEAEMQLTRSEGDFFRDMKYVQVPGIDTIWHQIFQDTVSDFPRLAASVSHVYGHPRAFTESFAAYRPPVPNLATARYVIDEQMVRGVNLVETMFYPATNPSGTGRGGPMPFMRDPGYPGLMQHTRRLSYVLSMGRPDAKIALYLPSDSMWLGDAASDTAFVSTERLLSERQIDFDIIGVDSLSTDLKPGPGVFETASGSKYKTVILPSVAVLPQASLDRLKAFAKGGGKVLFLGRTPSLISGKTILDAKAATPADFAFAMVETSAQLPATPTPPADAPTGPTSAPGPLAVPAAIEKAVASAVGTSDTSLDTADPQVKVMTRRLKDASVYFLFNESPNPASHTLTLRGEDIKPASKVEEWDADAGTVAPITAKSTRGTTSLKLDLKPYETKLLIVR